LEDVTLSTKKPKKQSMKIVTIFMDLRKITKSTNSNSRIKEIDEKQKY